MCSGGGRNRCLVFLKKRGEKTEQLTSLLLLPLLRLLQKKVDHIRQTTLVASYHHATRLKFPFLSLFAAESTHSPLLILKAAATAAAAAAAAEACYFPFCVVWTNKQRHSVHGSCCCWGHYFASSSVCMFTATSLDIGRRCILAQMRTDMRRRRKMQRRAKFIT